MRCMTSIRQIRLAFLLVVFISIGLPSLSKATTYYYVDPSFSGGGNDGSAAKPWTRLDQDAQWNVINTALGSDDVTVYFSARIVASDTAEVMPTGVYVKRTNTSTHLLTIDGQAKYNTNDTSGLWVAYTGTNRSTIQTTGTATPLYFNLYGSYINRNYITIQGLKIVSDHAGQSIPGTCGSNLTFTNLEVTQTTSGAVTGGGIAIGYAYNGSINCGSLSNITISNNIIHNVGGEGIYIGGCANTVGCTAAHSNITISGNTIYDLALDIGEGDGIDIKDGNSNVTVCRNTLYQTSALIKQGDGIVTESAATIERNYIAGFPRGGIVLSEYYDHATGFRNGPIIRNNIIVGNGGYSAESSNGITVYIVDGNDNWSNVKIYNNTIYGQQGYYGAGIRFLNFGTNATTGHEVKNNIASMCASYAFAATGNFTFDHDYNNYYATSGNIYKFNSTYVAYNGNLAAEEAHSINTDPAFVSTSIPYSASNFEIQSLSGAKDTGATLTGFTNDYDGITRPQGSGWDIGAIEAFQNETPLPPKNLRMVQ